MGIKEEGIQEYEDIFYFMPLVNFYVRRVLKNFALIKEGITLGSKWKHTLYMIIYIYDLKL